MKICGIVAEYNPFHNGHAYQARLAREMSGCDYLVAVMGGAFSQRGEPMLCDKWTRARMALEGGIDLAVELPALFAVRSADWFARGGIETLCALGCDDFCFGCEADDPAWLERLCQAEADESVRAAIQEALGQGKSLARARGEALSQASGCPPEALNAPNLALGLEYLRANNGRMRAHVVRRVGDYHGQETGEFASASAIRAAMRRGELLSALQGLPETSCALLQAADTVRLEAMDELLLYRLRMMPEEEIARLIDVSEGLEHRVARLAAREGTREGLIQAIKCKRYTYARLSRICAQALLGMTRELAQAHPAPEYIRVLGFRKEAAPLLREIKSRASLPLCSDPVALLGNPLFELERRATDLQSLLLRDPSHRAAGLDLRHKRVVI